jgi:Mrp family chromosome partitioning ATPase
MFRQPMKSRGKKSRGNRTEAQPGRPRLVNKRIHSAQTVMPASTRKPPRAVAVISRKGAVEKLAMAAMLSANILRKGYLVSPAMRSTRS